MLSKDDINKYLEVEEKIYTIADQIHQAYKDVYGDHAYSYIERKDVTIDAITFNICDDEGYILQSIKCKLTDIGRPNWHMTIVANHKAEEKREKEEHEKRLMAEKEAANKELWKRLNKKYGAKQ